MRTFFLGGAFALYTHNSYVSSFSPPPWSFETNMYLPTVFLQQWVPCYNHPPSPSASFLRCYFSWICFGACCQSGLFRRLVPIAESWFSLSSMYCTNPSSWSSLCCQTNAAGFGTNPMSSIRRIAASSFGTVWNLTTNPKIHNYRPFTWPCNDEWGVDGCLPITELNGGVINHSLDLWHRRYRNSHRRGASKSRCLETMNSMRSSAFVLWPDFNYLECEILNDPREPAGAMCAL